jgi:FKBP-type peptidyl-prolyl cis-trans isomerase FkpA
MFSRLLILFSFCVIVSSCSKSSDPTPCVNTPPTVVVPASEMTSLQAWVAANQPTAILAPSGNFYYQIITAGTGTVAPTTCSTVSVKYSGRLTNGFKFTSPAEETTGAAFLLGGLIAGWQLGLPLTTTGGTINLYLPPSLGYGANASASIPANSILLFTIQLVAIS